MTPCGNAIPDTLVQKANRRKTGPLNSFSLARLGRQPMFLEHASGFLAREIQILPGAEKRIKTVARAWKLRYSSPPVIMPGEPLPGKS